MVGLLATFVFAIQFIGAQCSSDSSESDNLWMIVAVILCSAILVMLVAVVCLLWKLVKLKDRIEGNTLPRTPDNNENFISPLPKITKSVNQDVELGDKLIPIDFDCDELDLEQNLEIDSENLVCIEIIETGLFNVIQKGELKMSRLGKKSSRKLDVMVKGALHQGDKTQQMMILDEMKALRDIGKHPNLLSMIGYVVNPEMLIVSEYAEGGNLRELLRSAEEIFEENDDVNFKPASERLFFDLISFAYQIANGMKFLSSNSFVHRQLALRSIYITKDKTIQIGDFSLARRFGNNEYYRIANKDMPLPFHWMAPETFHDHKFTEKSDVWSYGVVLYELFSLGGIPYEGVGDVLTFLKRGRRLPRPDYCDDEIYGFMKLCWSMEPDERPTFTKCVQFFEKYLEDHNNSLLEDISNRLYLAIIAQERLKMWTNGESDSSGASV